MRGGADAGGLVAGVDEAGRGPLAGPVTAAAVVLGADHGIGGLRDSKVLSPVARNRLETAINNRANAWAVGWASVAEVDGVNVLQAALLAMRRAVLRLGLAPQLVLVDGTHAPRLSYRVQTVVGGDARVEAISAASVLAKVHRDREMARLDRLYPQYGFASNMGYPTRGHIAALERHGASPVHRRTFAPVRRVVERDRALGAAQAPGEQSS